MQQFDYTEWMYSTMTDIELLNDSNNPSLLDAYRFKCLQVLQSRLEARDEISAI